MLRVSSAAWRSSFCSVSSCSWSTGLFRSSLIPPSGFVTAEARHGVLQIGIRCRMVGRPGHRSLQVCRRRGLMRPSASPRHQAAHGLAHVEMEQNSLDDLLRGRRGGPEGAEFGWSAKSAVFLQKGDHISDPSCVEFDGVELVPELDKIATASLAD